MHVASSDDVTTFNHLKPNDAESLNFHSDWVRASLYLSECLSEFKWQAPSRTGKYFSLSWGDDEVASITLPEEKVFLDQLQYVLDYKDLRADRTSEITSQLGFPSEYFAMILGLHTARNKHTFELITITQVICAHVAMIAKHALAIRRPDTIDSRIMPLIPTPGHGSFPSAHATEAFGVAEVIIALIKNTHHFSDKDQRITLIKKQAERIAVNRTVAGVHYPIDSWAGASLGRAVAQIILAKCGLGSKVRSFEYDAQTGSDFFVSDFYASATNDRPQGSELSYHCDRHVDQSELFTWLWKKVKAEYTEFENLKPAQD